MREMRSHVAQGRVELVNVARIATCKLGRLQAERESETDATRADALGILLVYKDMQVQHLHVSAWVRCGLHSQLRPRAGGLARCNFS